MPVNTERIAEKVSKILEEDLPDIRVQMTRVAATQDQILQKIEGVECVVLKSIDAVTESTKRLQQHEIRLASVETVQSDAEKKRDRWRSWFMGIGSAVATAVVIYLLTAWGILG